MVGAAQIVKKTITYILAVAITVGLFTAGSWGLWVMFIAWSLDGDAHRLIITATSLFWVAIGGVLWLTPRLKK